jgi:hypothetical protein
MENPEFFSPDLFPESGWSKRTDLKKNPGQAFADQ